MKKTLYITSGAPFAGKTTFVDTRIDALGGKHISRDSIRKVLLNPGDYYFKNEGKVFKNFIEDIQEAINSRFGEKDIYIDATHLNNRSRIKVINRLNLENVEKIVVLWFDVPLETLLKRNINEKGKESVPESAIRRMVDSMDRPSSLEYNYRPYEVWRVDEEGYVTDNF